MRRFLIVLATLSLAFPAFAQIPGEPIAIGKTPVVGGVNGDCLTVSSGKVGQTAACGGAAGLTVGTSTITSGTDTRVLFDNAGVLGEYAISGTGSVAMTTSPTLTTPTLGVAAGTSLALGGATIGTDALGVTGNMTLTGIGVVSANSASAGLTVTQAGAGNSFVVEDQASDPTPFVINAAGTVITGSTVAQTFNGSASNRFNIIGGATNTVTAALGAYVSNATGGAMGFSKSRSDTVGTQTVVVSGDTLGTFYAEGSDGTAFIPAAKISFAVDGTPGTNDMPGRIVLSTTADGAAAVTERMRLDNKGNVIVNTAAIATSATDGFLYIPTVAGTPTGVPTTYTGRIAMIYDTTGHTFWFYEGGAWKQPKTPAAAALITWQ